MITTLAKQPLSIHNLILIAVLSVTTGKAATFFVDATGGNDANSGTTSNAACKRWAKSAPRRSAQVTRFISRPANPGRANSI
jgi:hypothetical protein